MGTGAIRGQPDEDCQDYSPNSHHETNLNRVMACENCASRFNIFKKKRICATCSKQFCRNCMVKKFLNLRSSCQYNCIKCNIMESDFLNCESLMKLKIKDLQQYLHSRNISTQYCTEKKDLVDLIIRYNVNRTSNMSNSSSTSEEEELRSGNNQYSSLVEGSLHNEESNLTTSSPPSQETDDPQEGSISQDPSPNYMFCRRTSLSDVKNADDIDGLTIRQLKEILVTNYVDYRGCCEKKELIDRVQQLWKANQENVQLLEASCDKNNSDDVLCKICMDAAIDCVLLECGHLVACTKCGKRLAECPVCRQFVIRVVHIFKA